MVKTNQTTHPQQGHTTPPVVVSKPYSEHEHTTIIYKPSQQPPNTPHESVLCINLRPISTGQLHQSSVLASIPGLSTPSSTGSLTPHKKGQGELISKQASRLDAFSGYLCRT